MKSVTACFTIFVYLITYSILHAQYFSEILPHENTEQRRLIFNDSTVNFGINSPINLRIEGDNDAFYAVSQSVTGLHINMYNLIDSVKVTIESSILLNEPILSIGGINFLQSSDTINVDLKTKFKTVTGAVILPVLWKLNKAYQGIELNDASVRFFQSTDCELIYCSSQNDIEKIKFTLSNNLNTPVDAISINLTSLLNLKKTKFRDRTYYTFSACEPNNIVLLLDNSSSIDTVQKKAIVEGIYTMLDSLCVINDENNNNNTLTILTTNYTNNAEEIISLEGNFSDFKQNSELESRLHAWSTDTLSFTTNLIPLVKAAKHYIHKKEENLVLQVFNGYSNGNNRKRKPRYHEINQYLKQIEHLRKKECKFMLLSFKEMNETEAQSMSALIHGDSVYTSAVPEEFQDITFIHRENPTDLFQTFSSAVIASCNETQQRSISSVDTTSIDTTDLAANIQLIYPNPGRDIVRVYVSHLNNKKTYNLTLVDIFGKTVWQNRVTHGQYIIDISRHPAGIYFLMLKHKNRYLDVKKLIKQ